LNVIASSLARTATWRARAVRAVGPVTATAGLLWAVVQPDRITADIEHGVLTVTVPKAATAQPVRIPVGPTSGARRLES